MNVSTAKNPSSWPVALIGAGRISEPHLQGLSRIEGARVLGICDHSESMARAAADRFGVPGVFTDVEVMLESIQPKVVHVLTPPATHPEMAERCLAAGAHVIVEKPAAPDLPTLLTLQERAKKLTLRLVEDQNYRFNRPVREVCDLVRSGRLGEIREVEVRLTLSLRAGGGRYSDRNLPHPSHLLPGGVIDEFLTHLCYLAWCPLVDPPNAFERRHAVWSNRGQDGNDDPFRFDDLDAAVDAGPALLRVRFEAQSWPEGFTLTVRGTGGTAEADLFQPAVLVSEPTGGPAALGPLIHQRRHGKVLRRAARRNFFAKVMGWTPYEGLELFLTKTYEALQRGETPPVSAGDMERTQRMIETIRDTAVSA